MIDLFVLLQYTLTASSGPVLNSSNCRPNGRPTSNTFPWPVSFPTSQMERAALKLRFKKFKTFRIIAQEMHYVDIYRF